MISSHRTYRDPGNRRKELLQCLCLFLAHAGQQLKAHHLAGQDGLFGLQQVDQEIDGGASRGGGRWRRWCRAASPDAEPGQATIEIPPRIASTYSAPLMRLRAGCARLARGALEKLQLDQLGLKNLLPSGPARTAL